jgi:hypothetical protein
MFVAEKRLGPVIGTGDGGGAIDPIQPRDPERSDPRSAPRRGVVR